MAEHRSERLSELIKSEFGSILQRDIKDPRIGFVSVTDVEVSNDYSHVKISLTFLGMMRPKSLPWKGLESAKGFYPLRNWRKTIRSDTPPRDSYSHDSIEREQRIFELLEQVKQGKEEI